MATGNVKDPKKLSKSKILSNFDHKLQKETEESVKRTNALDLQLKLKTVKEVENASDKSVQKLSRTWKDKMKDYAADVGDSIASSALSLFSSGFNAVTQGVDDFVGKYASYYSNITTRLEGTGRTYNELLDNIKNAVTGSRATNVVSVLDNLSKLVNMGIAYNVEQRAFLETISEKIATTFNGANSTLLQLIRLNRADSTAAYLGMESALTEFLNARFSDTSYLTQNVNEQVSAAIYEATSQLGQTQGAEFEYVVQKWLSSFYESGVNTSTIQQIAQGLGYLGSGNVTALTGNTQLSNLFIAAANNAGLNYSDMLRGGIDASSVSRLLEGIYQQSRVIASSGDAVARSQYASMFGMTLSDITAMMQLTSEDLTQISSNMYTYSNMIARTESELQQVAARTSVSEAIQNTISNVMAEIGDGIAEDTSQFLTWSLAKMIEGKISIPIPFSSSIDVGTTMKAALLGYNILSSSAGILSALSADKGLSLSSFAGLDTYGGGFVSSTSSNAVSRTTGATTFYGTSESSAIASGSVAEMQSRGNEVVTSAELETDQHSIDDLYDLIESTFKLLDNVRLGGSSFTVRSEDGTLD